MLLSPSGGGSRPCIAPWEGAQSMRTRYTRGGVQPPLLCLVFLREKMNFIGVWDFLFIMYTPGGEVSGHPHLRSLGSWSEYVPPCGSFGLPSSSL